MARIATTCHNCGEVTLSPTAIVVEVRLPAVECSFSFRCPSCNEVVDRLCHPTTAEQLTACGVALKLVTSPAELTEHHDGPPLRYADLLAMRAGLADDDALHAELDRQAPGR